MCLQQKLQKKHLVTSPKLLGVFATEQGRDELLLEW
jgi:hypothetical protein